MDISLNIIMDNLKAFEPECFSVAPNQSFEAVSFIPSGFRPTDINRLYVGRLSNHINAKGKSSCCVIAAADCEYTEKDIPANTIIVRTDMDLLDFFNLVQDGFVKIQNWCSKMDDYLIHKRSIQDVLMLSEDVIGNMITISDSSFSLVAYTSGISCSDEITNNLISNGYHNQHAISMFNKLKLPEFWKDATDIYVNESNNLISCPIVAKVVHYNNSYFSHVVMLCEHRPVSAGLTDLFQMLINHLMVCFERQWLDNNQMPHVYDSLILDLMMPNSYTFETLSDKAKNAGLPVEGFFKLVKIVSDSGFNVMLQRLAQEVVSKIPQARITLFQDQLIVLIILPDGKDKTFRQMSTILNDVMYEYKASCGISDTFSSLADLYIAAEQADVALEYGNSVPYPRFSVGNSAAETRVRTFENCYTRYLIAGQPANAHLAKYTRASLALDKLREYDKMHGTNNLELLFIYLINDRKATETSILMHMHRNNVIYRIGRIEELIGMDLEDSGVRFRLLVAYETYSPKE